MLGILFPRKLAQEWPEAVSALQSNTDRLCSPFDLHATLKHILTHSDHHNTRSRSLLTPIPWQRTCNEAGIARHWCTCAQWVTLEPNLAGDWSNEVMRAARLTLESINSATVVLKTSGIRLVGLCEKLKLDRVSVQILVWNLQKKKWFWFERLVEKSEALIKQVIHPMYRSIHLSRLWISVSRSPTSNCVRDRRVILELFSPLKFISLGLCLL